MQPVLRVFIADDSALVRERVRAHLAEMENVKLAGQSASAPEAIAAIRQLRPDVAILDVRMPGGNGLRVLEAIKQDAAPPLIIVLTAFAYPQHRVKYLAAGADYFFDKAAEFEQVFVVLKAVQETRSGQEAESEA